MDRQTVTSSLSQFPWSAPVLSQSVGSPLYSDTLDLETPGGQGQIRPIHEEFLVKLDNKLHKSEHAEVQPQFLHSGLLLLAQNKSRPL